ncbi:MAG: type II secretion system minor pseudopilin GspJ [Pseudomarimonas sp.]
MNVRCRGFTLIEVLVAVAIFALAAGLAVGGMNAITRARVQLDGDLARLADLQFAIGLIERDLRGIAIRPVREGYGPPKPALSGGLEALELSRYGAVGALAQSQSDIARIGYQLDGKRLLRLYYPVLDRSPGALPTIDPLLDQVERIEWRYIGARGAPASAQWPPPRAGDGLPRAVELRLQLSDYGEIRRVFELPLGSAP